MEGPSNLLAAVHIGADGTLVSSHAAPGISVATSKDFCPGCYRIELSGTGAFTGVSAGDLIVQATAQSGIWPVANATGDQFGELTDDLAVIQAYTWVSSTTGGGGDLDNDVYVVIYRGSPPAP